MSVGQSGGVVLIDFSPKSNPSSFIVFESEIQILTQGNTQRIVQLSKEIVFKI